MEEKAKPTKPLPKRKPAKSKRIGDEDFEENVELYDENAAEFEGGIEPEEREEEENFGEENNENEGENNNGDEEQPQDEEEQASQTSSKRRFRSNLANVRKKFTLL